MTLNAADPELAGLLARLAPFARSLVLRAGVHAARLHADTVTPDHLLSTLMDEADSGAAAAVLHAFADPETISGEALALSPGLMVVASDSTLPFSPRAVEALFAARAGTERAGGVEIDVDGLFDAALHALDSDLRARLEAAGAAAPRARAVAPAAAPSVFEPGEPLFRRFSLKAKRALSAANRNAAALHHAAIGPAHIVLGCLKSDDKLAAMSGISFGRARLLLGDRTADTAQPLSRLLPPDPTLVRFLAALPARAESVDLLVQFHAGGTPELAQILSRHKLSVALLERARPAFRDPPVAG